MRNPCFERLSGELKQGLNKHQFGGSNKVVSRQPKSILLCTRQPNLRELASRHTWRYRLVIKAAECDQI